MNNLLFSGHVETQERVKVLVVDSDPKSVQDLASELRARGYVPLEATSFADGKRLWAAERPAVLIADVRLGQFNGLQLLLRARADRPDVQAVITCPFPDVVLEAETRRFGGTFIVKPIDPRQVVAALSHPTTTATPSAAALADERRRLERRTGLIPEFTPDRRTAERRGKQAQ